MPFTSQPTEKKGKCKNKQVMEEDKKGFESESDSDSLKIVGEEISDSSDDDIADSVGTKKKGAIYWPKTSFPDIVPPKARRMPGRPKKHRRREQGEDGGGQKLGKKGVMMHCSKCLKAGHNKSTCKAIAEEITNIQKIAAEAKKAQSQPARAQAALNSKKKTAVQGETSTEGAPQLKRNRERPPKAKNVEVLPSPPPLPPVGVGVYISDKDGHIYMSTVGGSTVRNGRSNCLML
ncbi:hypothetical protein POM88_026706 [Heracleum sosnowskyi]|uniref:Uncharacterized protein n=1 Tax=Heracleum sosnowskyi TaxID=360622 RepID=A0AAD8I8N3_9APIA|nr:hypothetical protein POM88_026706 [Heracleum sosnowskyi]